MGVGVNDKAGRYVKCENVPLIAEMNTALIDVRKETSGYEGDVSLRSAVCADRREPGLSRPG